MLWRVQHFTPSHDPAEGLGVLMLFRLIEEALPAFFRTDRAIQIARAPGRLDVLGGIGGAMSLSMSTAEAACAAIQGRDDELVRLWSPCRDGSRTQLLSVRLADLVPPEGPVDYEDARALLVPDPRDRWAAYILGGLLVLSREHGLLPQRGAELLMNSDVPSGCGVGASAAVTVAPREMTTARSMTLRSSRTLPGHPYLESSESASSTAVAGGIRLIQGAAEHPRRQGLQAIWTRARRQGVPGYGVFSMGSVGPIN